MEKQKGENRLFTEVFVYIPKEKRQKLDPKAVKCVFVGYENHSKSYRVWNPEANKIEVARDVIFLMEESMVTIYISNVKNKLMEMRTCQIITFWRKTQKSRQDQDRGAICDLDIKNVIGRRDLGDSSAYMSVSVIKDNSAKGGNVMAILNVKFNGVYGVVFGRHWCKCLCHRFQQL